jgi:hypothetical protein
VYDLFVEWIARPAYRFIVKPILFTIWLIKKFFKYLGKFLWHLTFATTGNIIEISIILTLVYHRAKIMPHIPGVNDHPWMFGVIMVTTLFAGSIVVIFAYNILNLLFIDRKEIIEKEPEFIQTIVDKIKWGFYNLRKDVVKSDQQRQEDKNAKKAIKMAARRHLREAKRKKEEERKAKLDIIHDRADILDL